jgi:hypothetical protein
MAQEKKSLVDEVLDDALQVRETALANAKLALEEAFEPRIKSMISRHLQNEVEDEEMEEGWNEEEEEMEEGEYGDEDEVSEEEDGYDDPTNADDASIDEEEHDDEMEEELEPSDIDDENEEPSDVASDDSGIGEGDYSDEEMEEEMEDEDDLDLEAVIAELEAELGGEEEEEEEMEMDMDSDEEEMEMDMDSEEDDEEIIDLDELLSALTEEEDEEEVVEEDSELAQENSRLASELAEHREAVEILRSKLNEVNLLNAKLLYTTKLFRKFNLSNDQKMKVVESFDRTSSVRETKLVFSTLAESLSMNNSSKTKKSVASITEGFASKPTTSTKPKTQEIISEGNAVADRFRRLISYNK